MKHRHNWLLSTFSAWQLGKFLCAAALQRSGKQIRQRRITFWWVQLYVRDAIACKKEQKDDLCQWIAACVRRLRACNVGGVRPKRRSCVRCPLWGLLSTCLTIALPSFEVMRNLRGLVYPCRTDEGQLDAPMQSQSNLECWQRMWFAIPIYPCLRLPTRTSYASHNPPSSHSI